jgi:6-phosphofructokinase 1
VDEAYAVGKAAVEAAVAGQTDYMVGLDCVRDAQGYHCQTKLVPLTEAANTERKVPLDWITPEGNGVTQAFVDYALPLIQGEMDRPLENGMPRFAKLKKVLAK